MLIQLNKQIILAFSLLLIMGLFAIVGGAIRSAYGMLPYSANNIKLNGYSVHFNQQDQTTEIFKISPYNDFYYTDLEKQHFYNPEDYVEGNDISYTFPFILRRLVSNQNNIIWIAKGKDNSKVRYEVLKDGKTLTLVRDVSNYKPNIQAIGQAIEYCKGCIVTDQSKRVYFNEELINQRNIDFAQSLQLTPISITGNLLPSNISELTVLDINGNPKMDISINLGSQIFLDEKYNLIEVRTGLVNNRTSQRVYLYN